MGFSDLFHVRELKAEILELKQKQENLISRNRELESAFTDEHGEAVGIKLLPELRAEKNRLETEIAREKEETENLRTQRMRSGGTL